MNQTLNEIRLIGRIGTAPSLTTTKNKRSLATFTLATKKTYKKLITQHGASGEPEYEYVDEACWHQIKMWGKQAELAHKYIKKGDLVYIAGSIKYNSWTDGDEQKHHSTDILAESFNIMSRSTKDSKQLEVEITDNLDDTTTMITFDEFIGD